MILNTSKQGAQGIGTLIIFISMILVAAVAAGVLIQTASSLQSKALDVGTQAQERVVTNLDILQIYGDDASDHILQKDTDKIVTIVRLGAGSAPIKITDMQLKVDTKTTSTILRYKAGGIGNSTYFASDVTDGYIETGDVAQLNFQLPVNITESEKMIVSFMPHTGSSVSVSFTTPSVMIDKIVVLK